MYLTQTSSLIRRAVCLGLLDGASASGYTIQPNMAVYGANALVGGTEPQYSNRNSKACACTWLSFAHSLA
jgi:hypothetical protein